MASNSRDMFGRDKGNERGICRSLGFRKGEQKGHRVVPEFKTAHAMWYFEAQGYSEGRRRTYYSMPDANGAEKAL